MTKNRCPVRAQRHAPPSRRSRHDAASLKPKRPAVRRKKRGSGGGNLEGAWILRSVGATCDSSTDAVVISSGKMIGQYGTGQVSSTGSVSGAGSAGGLSWTMSGRFSGRSGSGTFQRSDGCTGTWTGTKQ